MFNVTITEKGGSQTAHTFDKTEVTIGRVKGNDIVLPKGNVSKRHSRIVVKDGKFIIVDLKSTNGTYVNGRKISAPHVIKDSDKVYIGDFILTVREDDGTGVPSPDPVAAPSFPTSPPSAPTSPPSASPLSTSPSAPPFGRPSAPAPVTGFGPPKGAAPAPSLPPGLQPNHMGGPTGAPLPGLGRGPGPNALSTNPPGGPGPLGAPPPVGVSGGFPAASKPNLPPAPTVPPAASPFPMGAGPAGFAPPSQGPSPAPMVPAPAPAPMVPAPMVPAPMPMAAAPALMAAAPAPVAAAPAAISRATLPPRPSLAAGHDTQARDNNEFAMIVMEAFLDHFDPRELPEAYPADPDVKESIRQALLQAFDDVHAELPPSIDRDALLDALLNEAVGLGPLEYYLDDESITDIHVNGPNRIVLERQGLLQLADRTFTNPDFLYLAALRLLSIQGLGAQPPLLNEVRFSDGTLVQVVLPPVAVGAPVITIRKPRRHFLDLPQMIERGTLSPQLATFLQLCIEARRTLLVCGPRGAGRTSLTNALLGLVPDGARIIAVESTSMLQLPQRTAVTLEAQSASAFADAVTLESLVQHAQRLRPDRLILDELSGTEALGFLLTAAGGAAGSIGVLTALNPPDALRRLEQLSLLTGSSINPRALPQYIASSIDIVLCLHRFADGTRRLVEVSEVCSAVDGSPIVTPIFVFQPDTGRFIATGYTPRFCQALSMGGVAIPADLFSA
jgi:pilus assembly protein CpaF